MRISQQPGTEVDIDKARIFPISYRSFLCRFGKRPLREGAAQSAQKQAGRSVVKNICSA
jgi:hypothetical protein